mgnify:CR=1 FL=1
MIPLMKFFGWFDVIIATPFAIYLGYKGIKWIIGKLKNKQPQEGEIDTPDAES